MLEKYVRYQEEVIGDLEKIKIEQPSSEKAWRSIENSIHANNIKIDEILSQNGIVEKLVRIDM